MAAVIEVPRPPVLVGSHRDGAASYPVKDRPQQLIVKRVGHFHPLGSWT